MTGEGIVAGEAVAALARVGLDARVDFGVPLEVVLPHEALLAGRALVLPVVQMGLHVALDVLLSTEGLVAPFEEAPPLPI
jgi:hypothetical protein